MVEDGTLTNGLPTAQESAEYASAQFKKLNPEHKRFDNPHIYKVGISKKLMDLRDQLTKSLKP
jgi:nicotinate phosphoribosyltransferase